MKLSQSGQPVIARSKIPALCSGQAPQFRISYNAIVSRNKVPLAVAATAEVVSSFFFLFSQTVPGTGLEPARLFRH